MIKTCFCSRMAHKLTQRNVYSKTKLPRINSQLDILKQAVFSDVSLYWMYSGVPVLRPYITPSKQIIVRCCIMCSVVSNHAVFLCWDIISLPLSGGWNISISETDAKTWNSAQNDDTSVTFTSCLCENPLIGKDKMKHSLDRLKSNTVLVGVWATLFFE